MIINPWVIYWIDILQRVSFVSLALAALSLIVLVILGGLVLEGLYEEDEQEYQNMLKGVKRSVVIFIICGLIATFIPSKNTMYVMYGSKLITADNLNATKDFVVDFVTEIEEALNDGTGKG